MALFHSERFVLMHHDYIEMTGSDEMMSQLQSLRYYLLLVV